MNGGYAGCNRSIVTSGRMPPSLIGLTGQARFPFSIGAFVAHPGHASLRSLVDAAWDIAARMCRIGCGEPRFETRFSLRSSHFRLLPQTSSGEGRPR